MTAVFEVRVVTTLSSFTLDRSCRFLYVNEYEAKEILQCHFCMMKLVTVHVIEVGGKTIVPSFRFY